MSQPTARETKLGERRGVSPRFVEPKGDSDLGVVHCESMSYRADSEPAG
jgi:hypothetical protein